MTSYAKFTNLMDRLLLFSDGKIRRALYNRARNISAGQGSETTLLTGTNEDSSLEIIQVDSAGWTVNPTLEDLESSDVGSGDLFVPFEGYNISDVLETGNQTANGTGDDNFIFSVVILPMWVMLLVAVAVVLLCCVCLAILFAKTCCCQKKKSKKKKNDYDDKAPIIDLGQPYATGGISDSDESTAASLGKLQYNLDYDVVRQELSVGVIQATDVAAMDEGGLSDPYVKLVLLPDTKTKFKTKTHEKTLSPVFNEFFKFNVPLTDLSGRILLFSVYDHDRFSKDDMIGQVKVPFDQMDFTTSLERWGDLSDPVADDDIQLARGDICLTLQYNPASGKLTVIILECKNLLKVQNGEFPNPYVKVEVWRYKKKAHRRKTVRLEKTVNPYFNQMFVFDTLPDQLYLTSVVVTVMHRRLTVRKGTIKLGTVEMSAHVQGSGYKHWTDMIRNPRRSVAGWHTLVENVEK